MSTYTHAREFLARVVPWPENGEGFVNLHYKTVKENGQAFWNGTACVSLDDAIKQLDRLMKRDDTHDMFFCTSMQSDARERTMQGRNGSWTTRDAVREQRNVVAMKSLFIDLDVKDGAYPDTKTALVALNDFVTRSGMPKPSSVVLSGTGGAHVYWVLDEAIALNVWQPLANALVRAAKANGLMFDAGCTIDSARILRVPETLNYKRTPPLPTKLLLNDPERSYSVARIEQALTAFIEKPPLPPRKPITTPDELSAGVEDMVGSLPLIDINDVECPFIIDALATGGKDFNQPLWMHTSLCATFTKGHRADAHLMAKGHPDYTVESTDAMYDRKLGDRAAKDLGWPGCHVIGNDYGGCASCKFKDKGKGPLSFLKAAPVQNVPQPPIQDELPEGYRRTVDGLIEGLVESDTGPVWRRITTFKIEHVWAQKDPWVMHFTAELDGRPQKCHLAWGATATSDGVNRELSDQGFAIAPKLVKDQRELFVAWMDKLRNTKDAVVTSAPFGWVHYPNGKIEGFSFDGNVWGPAGPRVAVSPDAALAKRYCAQGDLQPWLDASKLTTDQRRPDIDALLAAAFAGPLVTFTGREGVMLSAYSSESGIGKTSTLKVSQAVWGSPKAMQGTNDTKNSVISKMGALKHLPMYWDELKSENQIKTFAEFIFDLSRGTEKGRMTRGSELREQGDWQTLLVLASNDSLLDAVSRGTTSTTDAGIMRVFEFPVLPPPKGVLSTNASASRILQDLNNNYGQPGLIYAKFLGENHARVDAETVALYEQLELEVKAQQEERNWTAVMATLIKGAEYGNELGLTDIDVKALRAHMITTFYKMRGERNTRAVDIKKPDNVLDILGRYLNSQDGRHTLKTDRLLTQPGKPAKDSVRILNDASKIDGIHVQLAQKGPMLRMEAHAFGDWLGKQGLSKHLIYQALEKETQMRKISGRLGAGTNMCTAITMHCLEIDFSGSKHAAMLGFGE